MPREPPPRDRRHRRPHPVGHDAASSAAAVRAGIARCSEYPFATPTAPR
ncbi:hypothetical protein [Nannocystis pusilla]